MGGNFAPEYALSENASILELRIYRFFSFGYSQSYITRVIFVFLVKYQCTIIFGFRSYSSDNLFINYCT